MVVFSVYSKYKILKEIFRLVTTLCRGAEGILQISVRKMYKQRANSINRPSRFDPGKRHKVHIVPYTSNAKNMAKI